MTNKEHEALDIGDRIRNTLNGNVYVIVYRSRIDEAPIAVRSISVHNPSEWELFSKSTKPKRRHV